MPWWGGRSPGGDEAVKTLFVTVLRDEERSDCSTTQIVANAPGPQASGRRLVRSARNVAAGGRMRQLLGGGGREGGRAG